MGILKKIGLALLVLVVLAVIFGGKSDNSGSTENGSPASEGAPTAATTTRAAAQGTQTNNEETVWTKTSGYTVEDCYAVCDGTYDVMAQVTVCQGNCDMYGKPSAKLDKYVNTVKNVTNSR